MLGRQQFRPARQRIDQRIIGPRAGIELERRQRHRNGRALLVRTSLGRYGSVLGRECPRSARQRADHRVVDACPCGGVELKRSDCHCRWLRARVRAAFERGGRVLGLQRLGPVGQRVDRRFVYASYRDVVNHSPRAGIRRASRSRRAALCAECPGTATRPRSVPLSTIDSRPRSSPWSMRCATCAISSARTERCPTAPTTASDAPPPSNVAFDGPGRLASRTALALALPAAERPSPPWHSGCSRLTAYCASQKR